MNYPEYVSSNHHTVALYGRLWFRVTSASRKEKYHFVDLEGFERWATCCNCEAWKYGERPCRHIAACLEALAHWCNVSEEHVEEFTERLMFLIQLNRSFTEAIQSPMIRGLINTKEPPPPEPVRKTRRYNLRPRIKNETTKSTPANH